jgi:hypothetical protein
MEYEWRAMTDEEVSKQRRHVHVPRRPPSRPLLISELESATEAGSDKRRRPTWRPIRFRRSYLRLYLDVNSGRVGIAILDENCAEGVKPGGETRPDDSALGIRWLNERESIMYRDGSHGGDGFALLPVTYDLNYSPLAVRAQSSPIEPLTGIWVPLSDAFWFSENFGIPINLRIAGHRRYFSVTSNSLRPVLDAQIRGTRHATEY